MEAHYIILIAVMYVLPILMVSSQEINRSPYATTTVESHSTTESTPISTTIIIITTTTTTTSTAKSITTTTTKTTTTDRLCTRDEHCSLNGYCNNTSNTCELKYQWVLYTSELEDDNRLVYVDDNSSTFVIIRLSFKNSDKVPYVGIFLISGETIVPIDIADNDIDYVLIEALLIEHGKSKWVSSSNGTILNNTIEGGIRNNETLYVCRIKYDSFHFAGHMQPSNRSCYIDHNEEYYGTYELLVHEM